MWGVQTQFETVCKLKAKVQSITEKGTQTNIAVKENQLAVASESDGGSAFTATAPRVSKFKESVCAW